MQSSTLVDLQFAQRCKRGAILRFEMACDDPNRDFRNKFGVILNLDTDDSEIILAITTSNPNVIASRFLQRDAVLVPIGRYSCFDKPTSISLREVKVYPVSQMKAQCLSGKLTFVGDLEDTDLTEIDQKLANSVLLEGGILKRIVKLS